jgi:VCBS repeat-containing protein
MTLTIFWTFFVYDRVTQNTERVSVATDGAQGNGDSGVPAISADGRYVVYTSFASNLVSGDTNNAGDNFIYDRVLHTTERISLAYNGEQGNGESLYPSISADGRYIAFQSSASNLVPNDTNNAADAFIYDTLTHTVQRLSLTPDGAQLDDPGIPGPFITADGHYIVFQSLSSSLVPNDTNNAYDIFVLDRTTLPGQSSTNHSPVASNIIGSANEDIDNAVTLTALFTDADLSDTFTFTTDATGTVGLVTNNHDGTFSYDPNGKFESLGVGETANDTFSYTVTDNHGASSTANATVTLHGENDAPIPLHDIAVAPKGKIVAVNAAQGLLANDTDPDSHENGALQVTGITFNGKTFAVTPDYAAVIPGKWGTLTVSSDGSYTYEAKTGTLHHDVFSYSITDGHVSGTSEKAYLNVTTTKSAAPYSSVVSIRGSLW